MEVQEEGFLQRNADARTFAEPGDEVLLLQLKRCPRELVAALAEAQERDIFLVNVTQCTVGSVDANRYVTGAGLTRLGVEPSLDITLEAALTKLMVLAALEPSREGLRVAFKLDMAGEQTPAEAIR